MANNAYLQLPDSLLPELQPWSTTGLQEAQVVQVSQALLTPCSLSNNLVPVSVWQDASLVPVSGSSTLLRIVLPEAPVATSLKLQQLLVEPTPQPFGPPIGQLQLQQQQQQQQPPPATTTIFFAGVTPIVDAETLLTLFAQFGRVMDLNLFRPYKGCRTSKGCGLVVYSQHSEAAAALETLSGRFVFPGARSPMVIEWCDPTKQYKRKRAQPLTPFQQQVAAFTQQALPTVLPAIPISLGIMPTGNAGRLVMPSY